MVETDNKKEERRRRRAEKAADILSPKDKVMRNLELYGDNLERIPKLNLGALFMPPIWGPLHGFWMSILFYPLILMVDALIRQAVLSHMTIIAVFGAVVSLVTIGFMVYFAMSSSSYAYLRVADKISVETYLKREKIWAVVCIVLCVAAVVFATWYNINVYIPAH